MATRKKAVVSAEALAALRWAPRDPCRLVRQVKQFGS